MADPLPCDGGGNYNPYYHRCVCPIGRSGPRCEVDALPACRANRGRSSAVSCTVRRPQHCDCVQQCVDAGAFAAHIFKFCFVRPFAAAAHSEVPAFGAAAEFYSWRLPHVGRWLAASTSRRTIVREPASADAALAVEHRPSLRHQPASLCPRRCHDRGACVGRPQRPAAARGRLRTSSGECRCDALYGGASCETFQPVLCWNNCSYPRGTCVDGFCSCAPPHFGPACAYDAPAAGAASRPRRRRFAVHVYDLDAVVLRRAAGGSDPDPIFNTYHTFLRLLLADPPSLAADPEEADLFLTPAYVHGMLERAPHTCIRMRRPT